MVQSELRKPEVQDFQARSCTWCSWVLGGGPEILSFTSQKSASQVHNRTSTGSLPETQTMQNRHLMLYLSSFCVEDKKLTVSVHFKLLFSL